MFVDQPLLINIGEENDKYRLCTCIFYSAIAFLLALASPMLAIYHIWDTAYSRAHATAQHTGLQLETMSQALFRGIF